MVTEVNRFFQHVRLSSQLPQLQLTEKLNDLTIEAIDFQMADAIDTDLPQEEDIDSFLGAMHDVKEVGSATPTYANLLTLVRALLALPASNADRERCFSMVRKIHTEERTQYHRRYYVETKCGSAMNLAVTRMVAINNLPFGCVMQ